jgi:hypothetical protein
MQIINTIERSGFRREKIYPWKAEGVDIVARPNAWGDPKVIIPIDGVTENYGYDTMPVGALVPYYVVGVTLISKVNPTIPTSWNIFRIHKDEDIELTATSGAGEASPDEVYVTSTATFKKWDLIWIADTNSSNGEIRRVDGITGNTLELDANLNNAYTVAADAKVYLIRRGGIEMYANRWGKFAAGGVRNMRTQMFADGKYHAHGDGVLGGTYGLSADDPSSTISFTVLFDSF